MPGIDFPDSGDVDGHDGDFENLTDDEDDDGATAGSPEDEPLALPSDFSTSERRELGLDSLAVFERRIRVGHAYDLLDAVKQSINHQGAFLVDKRKHARGQKDNTRSQKQVSAAAARTRSLAQLYNYNRDRLIALSDGEPSDVLKSISLKDDLKSKNWRVPRQQGDSREECAWIWTVVPPWTSPAEADAWQLEVDRVQWFRARADMTRVKEEINKLHAEFKRACLGFESMAVSWDACTASSDLSDGAKAYAKKKADMYRKLGSQCAAAFAKARKDPGEKWDYSSVSTAHLPTKFTQGLE
ncbi:hypothetical protein FOMPIDRAFT_1127848 [Fomitopsis schrenkii]|uniref:Uncharacterized protein n=1 Tax=Fomitopsis schrenkii TaxID=2126942 RepID=S8E331_FOMSC|nr:hypothetical protein FOMPIDRAFT_1127848 [Fomitopsis schrenkii]